MINIILNLFYIFNVYAQIISMENGNCWFEQQENEIVKVAFFYPAENYTGVIHSKEFLEKTIGQERSNLYLQCNANEHFLFAGTKDKCIIGKLRKNNEVDVLGIYYNNASIQEQCVPVDLSKIWIRRSFKSDISVECRNSLSALTEIKQIKEYKNFFLIEFMDSLIDWNMDKIKAKIFLLPECQGELNLKLLEFEYIFVPAGKSVLLHESQDVTE